MELLLLQNVNIPRCYKSQGVGKVMQVEFHHFPDASHDGYRDPEVKKVVLCPTETPEEILFLDWNIFLTGTRLKRAFSSMPNT